MLSGAIQFGQDQLIIAGTRMFGREKESEQRSSIAAPKIGGNCNEKWYWVLLDPRWGHGVNGK